MRPAGLVAAAATAAALAGCGSDTADLMAIRDTASGVAGTTRTEIRVTDDGRGACNRGPLAELPSQMLLDAREAKRDLRPFAKRGANFTVGGPNEREFVVRTFDGTVRWGPRPGLPAAIGRATALALRLERRLCPRA
jgi:hypothetical protein